MPLHLVWNDWLHARHRGSAESYQQICHPGLLCRWQGAWYVEPEQGVPYRDSLQENVHHYAASKSMAEIVEEVSGEPFNPDYYTDYLIKKYKKLYNLD